MKKEEAVESECIFITFLFLIESTRSHVLTRRKVSPLPTMQADVTLSPSALHLKGQVSDVVT